jgi:hypothetical protein
MWIAAVALSGLVALVFAVTGTAKVLGHPKMREAGTHLGYSMRAFRIIGLLEALGALGILLAPLCPPLSVAAATGLIPAHNRGISRPPARVGSDSVGHGSRRPPGPHRVASERQILGQEL